MFRKKAMTSRESPRTKTANERGGAARRRLILVSIIVVGGVAAFLAPHLIARLESETTTYGSAKDNRVEEPSVPNACDFILVVGRREERKQLDDPTPHRNSQIALYKKTPEGWKRDTRALPIRSTSTAINPGIEPSSQHLESEGIYGYVSIPLGMFSLKQGIWRDGKTRAFLVSDWRSFDGEITLKAPQVIRARSRSGATTVIRSSLTKQGSWIHPTWTEKWSHGDSNGCMNLYQPKDGGDGSFPYEEFLSWFDERDLIPGPETGDVPLLILPFDIVSESGDELSEELPSGIVEEARSLHGYQSEELKR